MAHGERTPIRRSAWSYTAGILISFIAFACLILILKVAGASVGWGFQLQSPWLVGLLSLLLFVIGLNLLGMFEFSGRFQNIGSDAINRSSPFSSFLTGVLAVIVATPCTAPFMAGAVGFALAGSTLTTIGVFLALGSDSQAELQSAAWSTEAVATARAEGRPVFVDFTAAWCVTCKVNEITVLKTSKTAALFERTDTEFLIADWTRKDDVIAAELAKFGRAGVPLYLVYKPGAETAEVLPQILTYEILRTALE